MLDIEIKELEESWICGLSERCTFRNNATPKLFGQMMPIRDQIPSIKPNEFWSIQLYDEVFDPQNFSPDTPFEKWVGMQVLTDTTIANSNFKCLKIEAGTFASFIHKGDMQKYQQSMMYFYSEWLPNSSYKLVKGPHFELLAEKYKGPTDPSSEEEIWIPIQLK